MTGAEVRQLREAFGLTQQQLAARLGCSVSTVSRWESGQVTVSAAYARHLREMMSGSAKEPTEPWRLAEWQERRLVTQVVEQIRRLASELHQDDAGRAQTAHRRLQVLAALLETWQPWTESDWATLWRSGHDVWREWFGPGRSAELS
jgi:transcriptional regulator with XRE-family HTH domain